MAKILGWVLMLLGIALLLAKFVFKTVIEKISFLSFIVSLNYLYAVIAGIILLVLGFLLLKAGEGGIKAGEEVPIYHGNRVVGYRRAK